MPRPVHYRATGMGGLMFDCYLAELNAHLASRREVPGGAQIARVDHDSPMPKGHTDLRRVTCPDCCRAIAKMMREKFTK